MALLGEMAIEKTWETGRSVDGAGGGPSPQAAQKSHNPQMPIPKRRLSLPPMVSAW